MKTQMISLAALALGLAAGGPGLAQKLGPDPNAPVDIESDSQDAHESSCTTVWSGHAQVTQGTARLLGQSITVLAPKKGDKCGQLNRIVVDKDVFYVTPDGRVRADHADYDVTNEIVVFTGQVVLVRGDDVETGSKLTVNRKTNDAVLEGKVKGVLFPEKKTGAAAGKPGK